MAWTVELIEGSEPAIPLFYSATGWAMLEKGLMPNDPERREIWGGRLEDQLVRQEDGKRVIPLKLQGEFTSTDALIDAVNALEERLRHAARFRKDGWGDEVFLKFQLHSATYAIRYPVCSGSIDKNELMNACASIMESGHRVTKFMVELGVTIVCESFWEADTTYSLENLCPNPGWWRWAAAPGDGWTEVEAAGGVVGSTHEPTIYEVMGYSLKMVIIADAADAGVRTTANIVVAAGTTYYIEGRVYSAPAPQATFTIQVRDMDDGVGVVIAASILAFPAAPLGWVKMGHSFATPGGCTHVRVECVVLGGAGAGTYYVDAIYLGLGGTAPVGWSSSHALVNHLDAGVGDLNVLCVTEIPGEVPAEIRTIVDLANNTTFLRVAKRTRDTPATFIWQLTPCNAHTTAEGGAGGACTPGYTDANCRDSDKIVDATSPAGSRINVTFAGLQDMELRCYWDILTDVLSYRGKFLLLLIAKMEGATDTATIKVAAIDEGSRTGEVNQVDVSGTSWRLYDGWEVLSYRIGTADDDLIGADNSFRVAIYAETDGTPTDDLHIAGAFLIPLDEGFLLTGDASSSYGAATNLIIKHMDGDKGMFPESATTYCPNGGAIGTYPLLEPEIENWLYFVLTYGSTGVYTLTDTYGVSMTYRPRGKFLRGSNPG